LAFYSNAVSQNAMCAPNAAVDVVAELFACSQPIKTRLFHDSLKWKYNKNNNETQPMHLISGRQLSCVNHVRYTFYSAAA